MCQIQYITPLDLKTTHNTVDQDFDVEPKWGRHMSIIQVKYIQIECH